MKFWTKGAARTVRLSLAIGLLSVLAGCATDPISLAAASDRAEDICGPLPDRMSADDQHRLAALDANLMAYLAQHRPSDMDLLRSRYWREPTRLRQQIRVCHQVLSGK